MHKEQGLTLLELMVTVGIIGVVFAVGSQSGMSGWQSKKGGELIFKTLYDELQTAKNNALARNTSVRMVISSNSEQVYTMTTFASATPVSTCSSSGSWTTIKSIELPVPSSYQITGSGITSSTCFYRDGSSSGTTYIVSPTDVSSTNPTYTITITIATGYLDVS